jgi:L-amino acid N-acyltransferase YncA
MSVRCTAMTKAHWAAVRAIYAEGIATGHATFETEVPEWAAWEERFLPDTRRVALREETVEGWSALSAASQRRVYAGVAEVSIYVAAGARGQGVGRLLLEDLIQHSESLGIWTLQAGIFPENEASIRLHRRCGFREVGVRERLGSLHGRWRDVLLMERRSRVAGRD